MDDLLNAVVVVIGSNHQLFEILDFFIRPAVAQGHRRVTVMRQDVGSIPNS